MYSWFLVVTLCSVEAGKLASNCNDYIVDGDLSYQDCITAVRDFPEKENLFSLRCDKGETLPVEDKK